MGYHGSDRYYQYRKYDRYRYHQDSPPSPNQEKLKKKQKDNEGPMRVELRRANVILGLITIVAEAFIIGAPYWRTTLTWYGASRVTNYWLFEGLFLICVRQGYQALSQCYNLYPIMGEVAGEVGVRSGKDFNIYPYLTSFRALMIMALLFSITGFVCSTLGLRCTTILKENSKQKRWVLISGGISHLLAALITCICVSWYAGEVVYQFYSPYYQAAKMKYTLGACLYVGWISMAISLVCGALMTCCTCCRKEKDIYEVDPMTAKRVIERDSRSSIDGSYFHASRRNSRYPDSDIEGEYSRSRTNSQSERRPSNRRMSKTHDPNYFASQNRRSSKVHDPNYHSSSSRRNSRADKLDFRDSANRRNSRKVSILAEDIAQVLLSAGKSVEYSPKSNRKDSVIQENDEGFI